MKEHVKAVPGERTAIAPYNFVPLPQQVVRADPAWYREAHASYRRNHFTGRIHCTLTTETPVFVRCGLTAVELAAGKEAKNQPDFFYQNPVSKQPVIPGSSLRGLLRSLVEIASHSKIDRVTDRQRYFYRAVADPNNDSPLKKTLHRSDEEAASRLSQTNKNRLGDTTCPKTWQRLVLQSERSSDRQSGRD
jgi:CRISPR-associated protein (TIGR03986 family)